MAEWKGVRGSKVNTDDNFDPIPAGTYALEIKKTDWIETKAGDGHYLKLEMSVIKGEYKGRKVWSNLNLDNPNVQAVEISEKQVMQLVEQIHGEKRDIESLKQLQKMLKGAAVKAKVGIQPASGDYSAQNKIVTFNVPTGSSAADKGSGKKGKKGKKKKSKDMGW